MLNLSFVNQVSLAVPQGLHGHLTPFKFHSLILISLSDLFDKQFDTFPTIWKVIQP
jgi:hypothetical protein